MKELIIFFKNTKVLTIVSVFSVMVIISYKITENMPELFLGADYIYNLLYQLSFAYLSSYIFYIIQVYIPDRRKSKNFNKHIAIYIRRLFSTTNNIFKSTINKKMKIQKNIYQLSDSEIEEVCKLIKLEEDAPLADIHLNYFKYREFIKHEIHSIGETIDKLLKYGHCLDEELIILVDKIYNSQFHFIYDRLYDIKDHVNLGTDNMSVFSEQIINYINIFKELREYCNENDIFLEEYS